MQILSIKGENIASLAKPFEIRLDTPPLSAAGLFAITGETGAGKSSLLDAMCLALYGNCPRLSGDGTREKVADVGGEALSSTDARMVLRRGAITGYAEVTFQASDGETYVAGWKARRARDRIDGRLQNVDRILLRVSDGQVLETQVKRVDARVVELTGLTYDEFRRTVLLAQGDFDAFLGARTDERAAILEKVTGTGIYRDISKRVYERSKEAASALATLETRRGEHQLLTPEERAQISEAVAELRALQTTAGKEAANVDAELARFTAFAKAEANLAAAATRVTEAETAQRALADRKRWLVDWDRARALRGEARALKDTHNALKTASHEVTDLVEQQATQAATLTAAKAAFGTAQQTWAEAERVFKAFGPIWTKAEALDAQVMTAEEEWAKAVKSLSGLRGKESAAETHRSALLAEQSKLDRAIGALRQGMAAVEGHGSLLANWGVIEENLAARIKQAALIANGTAESERLSASIADDRSRRDRLKTETENARERIRKFQAEQDETREEREGLAAAAPAARLDRLMTTRADLLALRRAGEDVRRADEALTGCRDRRATAEETRSTQRKVAEQARTQQMAAAKAVDALRQPAEAAEAAASREAEHLRRHLVDGEQCPVCGSTSHPVMEDAEIARLAAEIRFQLAGVQQERDDAQREVDTALTLAAAAEKAIEAERAQEPMLSTRAAEAQASFSEARSLLETGPLGEDLPSDPHAPDETYGNLLTRLNTWRDELEQGRARLEDLDRAAREAARHIGQETGKIADRDAAIREIETRIATREREIDRLEQAGQTARVAVDAIDAKLAPLLAPTNIRWRAFGPEAETDLETLRAQVKDLLRTRAEIETAQNDRAARATNLAEANATLAGAQANRSQAETVELDRRVALDRLRSERADLLDGEETGAHRTRHNEARTAARDARDSAQAADSEATRTAAAVDSSVNASRKALAESETRAESAQAAFAIACGTAGLTEDEVRSLHAADPAEIEATRQIVGDADHEKTKADGARREREEELARLNAQGLPDTPAAELEAHKQALADASQERSEQLGRLSQQLDADALAARALAGLEKQIEDARKTAETWVAVNDAVGSANGSTFARIAQAVTLALLVERANHHLEDLKPRYQLRVADSDLALHVIDRDMAGDARPTRLLSGGERFLVSLALALALSGLGTRGALAGTLFIDEGFGSLDSDSLDLAIDALERLQAQGRTIGVISHVQAMKDRIPVQLQVAKTGGGASEVRLAVR